MPNLPEISELQRRIALYDDEQAYKGLFIIFYKPLLHFAGSFLANREMAEEVVSDVFVSVWQNRKRLEEIRNLKVYLYVSAKNNSLKYLLKQQKTVAITLDQLAVEFESELPDPEQLMITAEMMQQIRRVVEELPPRCKMIYKLIKEDRLKYKEVAEILNISVKTIDNQLAIALKRIAAVIAFDLKKVS
jgi:RNA polymerase sigma-70 factor (ECF subfamily)